MSSQRLLSISLGLAFAGVSLVATAAPTAAESRAARGVETAALLNAELSDLDNEFVFQTRLIAGAALKQLNTSTTFEALLAPGGVTLNCAVSGTLKARLANTWPRVLKLEWAHCVRNEFGMRVDVDGPSEVTLSENSLQPTLVLAIRFGDQNRDYVDDQVPETPVPWTNGQVTSRNLRVTGFLPMTQEWANNFPGRYLVEAKGFIRRTTRQPEYNSAGEPSPEFYNYEFNRTTDGALLTGAYTASSLTDFGLITGKVSTRFTFPTRPSGPTFFLEKWLKGSGLTLRRSYDSVASRYSISVDGKVEGDFNQFWPIGCTGAETFTFRTRAPLTTSPLANTVELYDGGELQIDGKTVAKFSATGTQPGDLMARVVLNVPGTGTFIYDYPSSVFRGSLNEAGRCTY